MSHLKKLMILCPTCTTRMAGPVRHCAPACDPSVPAPEVKLYGIPTIGPTLSARIDAEVQRRAAAEGRAAYWPTRGSFDYWRATGDRSRGSHPHSGGAARDLLTWNSIIKSMLA